MTSKITKEVQGRMQTATDAKDCVMADVKEVYYFCMDGKADDPKAKVNKLDLMASLPAELGEDFVSDLTTYFMPEFAEWIDYEPGIDIDPDFEDEAKEAIGQRKDVMQVALSASNLYGIINTVFMDFNHGTAAMWAHHISPSLPMLFEPIPFSELFVNIGRYGELDDRFRKRELSWKFLFDEYPSLMDEPKFKQHKTNPEKSKGTLIHGFFRTDDYSSGKWREIVMVEDKVIEDNVLDGIEDVPLIVGRFRPSTYKPWGFGPARRLLPDLRTFNEVNRIGLDQLDRATDPSYAAIGNRMGSDFQNGIEQGQVYELEIGASLSKIDTTGDIDLTYFSNDRYEARLMRGFYQDGPRQRGLTPPSATQWLEEAQRIQKRLGRPAGPIFDEFIIHLVKRADHLLTKIGRLDEGVEINGNLIIIAPVNPLTQAQRQAEIVVAKTLMQDIFAFEGANAPAVVDTSDTFRKMKGTYGDRLVTIRSPEDVQKFQQQQAQLMAAQSGSGEVQQ